MDWKTSLDWYCSGNTLDKNDIELLENEYQQVLKANNNELEMEVAPKHICKKALVCEGSFWITCLASVLDQLSPISLGQKTRGAKVFDELTRNGYLHH